jgi:hypothetical protein
MEEVTEFERIIAEMSLDGLSPDQIAKMAHQCAIDFNREFAIKLEAARKPNKP